MFWGIALVLVGILLLLDRAGMIDIDFGDFIIPVVLIAWGLKTILNNRKH